LVSLADELSRRVVTVEQWLKEQASQDARVTRLQTHPGVGLLTSLCVVHTLGADSVFIDPEGGRLCGFDPMEDSSAERKVYGGISKAGSRLLRYLLVEAGPDCL
jgi:transposase